jgi:CRISPR-associated protein Cas1
LAFGIETIRAKLKAALATLDSEFPEGPAREKATAATLIGLEALDSGKADTLSLLLATEGKAAFAYWSAWRTLTLNWKATSRYPIPEEWKGFQARSSVLTGVKHRNRRASNPINAMLNYAYAVLMTDMRIKALAEGYDPMIGVLHNQRHYAKERTPSFALDLMEPLRPVVDRAVLRLVKEETFSGADFVLQSDGVCRLNPELVRAVAASAAQLIGSNVGLTHAGLDLVEMS